MLSQILISSLQLLSTFYLTLVLLRFLLQLARADFFNPITQFVVKATNPPLRPLRRIIPGIGGVDGASLVLAVLIQGIVYTLILLAGNAGATLAQSPLQAAVTVLAWSGVTVLSLIVKIYFWSILAVIIISWVAPASHHPAIQLLIQLTEPIMRPFRNLLPPMGGLDLSPILVFLVLNVVNIVIAHLGQAVGLGHLGLLL
ncbi:YggT family protein [Marinobacteraceae bacterium S3BR75-40.1]